MFPDFWDSDSAGSIFKDGDAAGKLAKNETISRSIAVPAGATKMQLKFGYFNAANDWWWAIDNISVKDAALATVYSEDFEAVTLGPSVNERSPSWRQSHGRRITTLTSVPRPNSVHPDSARGVERRQLRHRPNCHRRQQPRRV